ncbi:MAG: hypothetical protein ACI4TA_05805 [Acetatifactor sp.]
MKIKENLIITIILINGLLSCAFDNNTDIKRTDDSEIIQTKGADSNFSMVSAEAIDYYDNVKTIMYATNVFVKPNVDINYENICDNDSNFIVNPMSLKLLSLKIYDEDTDKNINFYDLTREQQEFFIDKLLDIERTELSYKINAIPELKHEITLHNIALGKVIDDYKIAINPIGVATKSSVTKEGDYDVEALFERIHKEIISVYEDSDYGIDPIAYSKNNETIDKTIVLSSWADCAVKGNILVALPVHGKSWQYININKDWAVGHTGIINEDITKYTKDNELVTIECLNGPGVVKKPYISWATKHYLMGLQFVNYKWSWRKFSVEKTCTIIDNPSALANIANKYLDCEYVSNLEFMFAKWVAPERFTCTTLIWWCAKQAYGINLSNWFASFVSPSAIYLNDHTYLIKEVK